MRLLFYLSRIAVFANLQGNCTYFFCKKGVSKVFWFVFNFHGSNLTDVRNVTVKPYKSKKFTMER